MERLRSYRFSSFDFFKSLYSKSESSISIILIYGLDNLSKVCEPYIISSLCIVSKGEGFVTQKAVEYLHSYKVRRESEDATYSLKELYSIFKKYEKAKKKGEKLSLKELGREFDIIAPDVGRILARVGLEPMYGKNIRARKNKIDAVKRGFNLDLSTEDIGYFLEHLSDNVIHILHFMGRREKRYFEIGRLGREHLTYRQASQIYEAQDAGFNESEITELFDVSYDIVEYALAIRYEGIEKKLIKDLRVLFNDKTIKTPYVTKEMREKFRKED